MPRLFRESPLNSIWEGSGNVQCLDVLRAMIKSPGLARGLLRRGRRRAPSASPASTPTPPPCATSSPATSRRSRPAPAAWSSAWPWPSRPRCWSATATKRWPTPSAPPASPATGARPSAPSPPAPTSAASSTATRRGLRGWASLSARVLAGHDREPALEFARGREGASGSRLDAMRPLSTSCRRGRDVESARRVVEQQASRSRSAGRYGDRPWSTPSALHGCRRFAPSLRDSGRVIADTTGRRSPGSDPRHLLWVATARLGSRGNRRVRRPLPGRSRRRAKPPAEGSRRTTLREARRSPTDGSVAAQDLRIE